MPKALWWGRFDQNYSRNRIVTDLFYQLGWEISAYRPMMSRIGFVSAYFNSLEKPDIVWLPCFRHTDISSASFWARKWEVPLVIDPLISAYEKDVFEREKWGKDSWQAKRRLKWEQSLFAKADIIVGDTLKHLDFYEKTLHVERKKLFHLYVGAEEKLFFPKPHIKQHDKFEVLFYGSFLELHGIDTIVEAARLCQDTNIQWTLLGDGALRKNIEKQIGALKNISIEYWIPYKNLPDRLAKADILLGVFGNTTLTTLVIPNKVFQSMALAKPIITGISAAYPDKMLKSNVVGWVNLGNPKEILDIVRQWTREPQDLLERGKNTRNLFNELFSYDNLKMLLEIILNETGAVHLMT
jgi:glycosyltransferase involved in cell wall biosynthesis